MTEGKHKACASLCLYSVAILRFPLFHQISLKEVSSTELSLSYFIKKKTDRRIYFIVSWIWTADRPVKHMWSRPDTVMGESWISLEKMLP